jgi:dihydroorotate dehydrogenase (fumarate)
VTKEKGAVEMNLTSSYLGFELANPIVCGASPLGTNPETVRQLEEAGIAAVVLPSLFEEEIQQELAAHMAMESTGESFAEAMTYQPRPDGYHVGPDRYLDLVSRVKDTVKIPVIGSLNGATPGGWTRYAKKIQDAGADGLELNVFHLATDAAEDGAAVEDRALEIVKAVKSEITIPVAVKLSPFYSSIANLVVRLEEAGADGITLFNRFYQPDIDVEELEVVPNLRLSTSDELRLRLRWLAILSGKVKGSLSASGGAHTSLDVIKAVMAGAHSVQLVSALLIHGADHVKRTLDAIQFWMRDHDYESIEQMCGSMSLEKSPNPSALARANYMKVLDSWEV